MYFMYLCTLNLQIFSSNNLFSLVRDTSTKSWKELFKESINLEKKKKKIRMMLNTATLLLIYVAESLREHKNENTICHNQSYGFFQQSCMVVRWVSLVLFFQTCGGGKLCRSICTQSAGVLWSLAAAERWNVLSALLAFFMAVCCLLGRLSCFNLGH